MSEWQPIETAPHDELVLTVWAGIDNKTCEPVLSWVVATLIDGQWWTSEGDPMDEPTHWMSLPEPPKLEKDRLRAHCQPRDSDRAQVAR